LPFVPGDLVVFFPRDSVPEASRNEMTNRRKLVPSRGCRWLAAILILAQACSPGDAQRLVGPGLGGTDAAALVRVSVVPRSAELMLGDSLALVTWGHLGNGDSIVVPAAYSATGGTITMGGLYIAGTTPGTYRVVATQQAGTESDTSIVTIATPGATTLRELAAARGFLMGAAAIISAYTTDMQYGQVLGAQYNSLTPGNELKFGYVHPTQATYYFTDADRLVNFALANGAIIPLANIGGLDISVQTDMPPGSTGTLHLVTDVTGYFQ